MKSANFLGEITHVVELFASENRLCLAVEKVPNKTVVKSTLSIILKQVDVEGVLTGILYAVHKRSRLEFLFLGVLLFGLV